MSTNFEQKYRSLVNALGFMMEDDPREVRKAARRAMKLARKVSPQDKFLSMLHDRNAKAERAEYYAQAKLRHRGQVVEAISSVLLNEGGRFFADLGRTEAERREVLAAHATAFIDHLRAGADCPDVDANVFETRAQKAFTRFEAHLQTARENLTTKKETN